jgi:hypothetical protein
MKPHASIGMAFVLVLALVACVVSGPLAAGQAQEATLAGCLQATDDSRDFKLVLDDKEAYQVQPADGVELAPHANHRVELTGTIEKTESSMLLKATALKMVATSCES